MDKVKFYSATDWSCGYELQKAEEIIRSYKNNQEYNIVELMEFYNIVKYIDNKIYLTDWSSRDIEEIKKVTDQMKRKIYLFFDKNIEDKNFGIILDQIIDEYMEDFFEILNNKIDKVNISNKVFKKEIENHNISLKIILENKSIVKRYSLELEEIMIKQYMQSAKIIIEQYYLKEKNEKRIYIPNSLTSEDIEKILINYIKDEYADSRYVELLSKDNKNGITINDKTKLLAKRKSIELREKIFKNSLKFETEYLVALDNDMDENEGKDEKYHNEKFEYKYSKKWIENNLDFPTILNNFIYLFEYTDKEARIQLVNLHKEVETFEIMTNLNAKDSYNPNSTFETKRYLSLLQFKLYYEYLKNIGIRLEEVIEWFFNKYLIDEFGIENFTISMPSEKSNFFEKCKSILPEFDHILKEYKFLVEDGIIDPELVSISSTHMFFKDIPSMIKNKYIYLTENEDNILTMYYLFSDQCMLKYLPSFKEKYSNFCEAIIRDKVRYDEYNEYERNSIDWLANKKLIFINEEGYIKIKNINRLIIYKELNDKEVICYWKNSKERIKELNIMIEEGLLYVNDSLFSKNEQDYFNYYLNKSEFVDGYDIRNANLHGTQEGDRKSDIHYTNYLQIMILLVLIVIKINDELCLYHSKFYNVESNNN